METICGIYKITNVINNKVYIGKSVDIYDRWTAHKRASKPIKEGGDNFTIHKAIRKYSIENFTFEIIEKCTPDELSEKEIFWIKYFNSYYNGYNDTLGGDGDLTYDYEQIYTLWLEGYTNKEICDILGCNDQTVTRAFRSYNISEEQVRSRSNCNPKKPIVAIDIKTKLPLKVFNSIQECCIYFQNNLKNLGSLHRSLRSYYRWNGYYWEYLNKNNRPKKELNDKEFFEYQQEKLFTRTEEIRENISQKNRKVNRCSRDELKKLIRILPFTQIGKKFGVSDNAIRKWCDYYNLPRRVKDIKAISDEDWNNI